MIAASPYTGAMKTFETKFCPRCEQRLRQNHYDEPTCPLCGYVDYHYTSPNGRSSLLGSATRTVLRYIGRHPPLSEMLVQIQLVRLRNGVVYAVRCPFCDQAMRQSSLSGKRREAVEERYKCPEGHRVSLQPGRNGGLGWR